MVSVPAHRRGFTLIELLMSIGIIALLAGMILFAVSGARTAATKARIAADLQTIATALEAYKQDFRDYPRFNALAISDGIPYDPVANTHNVYGSQLLCWALIAPASENLDGAGAPGSPAQPGPGFRTRRIGAPGALQGNPYGPYIKPDNFKIARRGNYSAPAACDNTDEILDYAGHPILYYPANPNRAAVNVPAAYVGGAGATPLFSNGVLSPFLFDPRENDNGGLFTNSTDLQTILSADPATGAVAAGKQPAFTGPYILWSAGVDGNFGLDATTGKSDDITNFER